MHLLRDLVHLILFPLTHWAILLYLLLIQDTCHHIFLVKEMPRRVILAPQVGIPTHCVIVSQPLAFRHLLQLSLFRDVSHDVLILENLGSSLCYPFNKDQ